MNDFLEFLIAAGWVSAISATIVIIAIAAYLSWLLPALRSVKRDAQALTVALQQAAGAGWSDVQARLDQAAPENSAVQATWRETVQRAVSLAPDREPQRVLFGSPVDLWTARGLLARRINLDLAETVPNLLVGVGLLFTFCFLTQALSSATAALTEQQALPPEPAPATTAAAPAAPATAPESASASAPMPAEAGAPETGPTGASVTGLDELATLRARSEAAASRLPAEGFAADRSGTRTVSAEPVTAAPAPPPDAVVQERQRLQKRMADAQSTEDAIRKLLQVAGTKFLTSLAGLLASIVWTFFMKRGLRQVEDACTGVLDALSAPQSVLPTDGHQHLLSRQLADGAQGVRHAATLVAQGDASLIHSDKLVKLADEAAGLSEELLTEAREQTGTFKRFETDLAVSLANAIGPQIQAMTDQLAGAINGLSERLSTMNEQALQKMLDDFAGMLRETTQMEMTGLREALVTLAQNLEGAGNGIGANVERVSVALGEAGDQLVNRSETAANALAQTADNIGRAAESLKLVMNDLDVTIASAVQAGRNGIGKFHAEMSRVESTVGELGAVSLGLGHAAQVIETASSSMAATGSSIQSLSEDFGALAREQRAMVTTVEAMAPKAGEAVQRVSAVFDDAARRAATVLEQASQQTMSTLQQTRKAMDDATAGMSQSVSTAVDRMATVFDDAARRASNVLDQSAQQSLSTLNQTRAAMEIASKAMEKTVGALNEGATAYSKQINDLHHNLDHQLARAVGSLDKGINDLQESIEDLGDSLETHRKASR